MTPYTQSPDLFLRSVVGLQILSHAHWYRSYWRPEELAFCASLKCSFSGIEIMPFISPWFTAASKAFIKISVRFEHKQLPTKCYTTCALTTYDSDYTTYRFGGAGFGLLHTITTEIHIISKEGGSEQKIVVQSEHSFFYSKRYPVSCASHKLLSRFLLL